MNVDVISKATGAVTQVSGDAIDLDAPSIVRLDLTRAEVAGFEQQGHDLIVRLANGETIRVVDFYPDHATIPNDLVLKEGDGSLWLARTGAGTPRFSLIDDLDKLIGAEAAGGGGSSLAIPALLGGLAAAAGIAAIAGGGGDDDARPSGGAEPDPGTGTPAPDRDPPAAPTGAVRADGGAVTGRGEPGATVSVRDATGAVIGTAVVAADGSYTATVSPAQVNGERLSLTQADPAGNVSPATPVQAPDITAPAAPTAAIDATGTTVTGRGEAGATVTVRDASGAVLGTAVVAADGSYTVTLSTPRIDGQTLTVTQADAAGNVSSAASAVTPDLTAPAAPTAAISGDGAQVSGRGEPGATVTIRGAGGTILATAVVAADGSYTAALSAPQANGEALSVTQTDAAGNASPAVTVTAPDSTAPTAPVATINGDGTAVTGTGEPGGRVTVTDATGAVLGSAIVAPDGGYTVTLATPQANGGTLSISQTDPAGNASPAVSITAPDITAPAAPVAAINGDGTAVTGTGEAGSRVTVTDATGAVLGSAVVAADGSYTVTLATPQANGGALSVTQTDPSGNASPAVTLTAPDITAPAAPVATITGDGTAVTGTGEAGSRVTVTDATGTVLGSAVVAADGSYTVTLAAPQANGGTLSISQTDPAGNASPAVTVTAPDITAPAAPTIAIDATGTQVSGTGEPGARVTITDPAGATIGTAIVAANGSYAATLNAPQVNGERIEARQSDAAGNASGSAATIAPDFTAPAQPTATIAADGTSVSGAGEPGARITVADASGATLGTATVAADGSYSAALTPAQANGQALTVVQTDGAGNAAPPLPLTAPDITGPAAPVAALDATGSLVGGTGEAGARVTVRDATGTVLGTAIVGAQGNYTVVLSAPQVASQALSVSQSDAAGNASPSTPLTAPDLTPPAAPTATVGADGTTIGGSGEPGAILTVRDPLGVTIATVTVAADGSYAATLSPAQTDGEILTVRQADAAGNVSPPASATAPDLVADTDPDAPTAAVTADGTAVTGVALGGAGIVLYDANGTVIATGTANADGSYSVALSPPRIDGETIRVTQSDADGDVSPPATTIAPDLTAPAAPGATLDATGTSVTGTAEAGAAITVRAADGTILGTAVANANGAFAVVLGTPQANGGTIVVTQADAAGNVSPPTNLAAPDLTAPAAPAATVSADGSLVTGTGEPGTTATVRDAAGVALGSATVAPDGSYTVTLATPQANGQALSVTLTDTGGNVSAPTAAVAPDITAPAAPTATVAGDGTAVAGTGEPGATVTVTAPGGAVLGTTTVGAGGSYVVTLTTPQANGQLLSVTQSDAAGNASPATNAAAPDITAPAAPTATVSADGTVVTGIGEAGATITITSPAGAPIGSALVAADGSYSVALTVVQTNGERLGATQADAAGNVSGSTVTLAPDLTAPALPTAAINGDGTIVTGTGEAGATVTIVDAAGTSLGSAVVAADGRYTVPLTPAQANGETLSVSQADAAGNASPAVGLTAPDITAPAAPTATVSADGTIVTGTGEAGARVTITSPAGAPIGTAVVAADGSYSATLTQAQTNGERLGATQSDAAGNVSGTATAVAPDLTAPALPTAAITADGTTVSGTGEAGATITVSGPGGTPIGTATVASDGSYTATLTPAQANGEALTVVQADAAGNVSPVLPLTAPDITAPPAPPATLDATGTIVTGTGEVGATVTVRDAAGTALGTGTVNAQGAYTVVLGVAQIDSQALAVVQADAAGNVSAATPLTAPDRTAPVAPTATVAADGLTLAGAGEAGATVTVRDPLGVAIGTAVVAADGSYSVALAPAQTDGEILSVTQADRAGNVSPPAVATAPDLVADSDPDAPTAAVAADGASVAGVAEGGAAITVYNAVGTVIATGVANPDGSYSVALSPAQVNGELVRVTQTQPDGDVSPPATATAPDLTAPAAPTATLDATGAIVTGTGEPGATITVRAADGTTLGTASVTAGGAYAVTLASAQTNGQTLAVTQADAAGNVSPPIPLTAPDFTAPAAPVATVSADGTAVTGTGEAGSTATVRDAGGAILGTAVVAADGSFTVALATPQANGQTVAVTLTDAAGNVSPSANALAPDITAPAAPVLTVNADGTVATGTGEPGATVTLTGAGGTPLGTAVVAADGGYAIALAPAQNNGQPLVATQADAAGNVSAPATATAPDLVAPLAPTATVSPDGLTVSGTGEAGARIVIADPAGAAIGVATVAADGTYSATLSTPQVDGERLTATQTDGGGNVSPPVAALAPDLTAPAAPTLTIAPDGGSATGTGEPGATITLVGPGGATVGTVAVAADGSYAIALVPARVNGEAFTAVQADAAGNASPPANAVAPDLTAPAVPTATISGDGTTVTGTGEAGATVRVGGAGGPLGSALVAADGSYTIVLTTPQANGQPLVVTQADPTGNVSPPLSLTAPDITAPPAPSAIVSGDGTSVSGIGEAGATVTITAPGGAVIGTAVAAADGSYTALLATPQANGELLGASQRDAAGNVSAAVQVMAPDITAPALPTATVTADGGFVTGRGEPGATVTVTGPGGAILGTASVAANGDYAVTLAQPQTDGQALRVTQADATGNVSPAATVTAPDSTSPLAPTASVNADGSAVIGTGIAGDRITVTSPAGVTLGTAIVAADNTYVVTLAVPQRNGELLGVVQSDPAGNASPPIPALAPDITAPAAPTAIVGTDGLVVTGTGEAGATVTITGPGGTPLGTATVGATGSYAVTLASAQLNGETLVATQRDPAGNLSGPATAVAPDITPPAAPAGLAVAADGTALTGTGEAGARVEVRSGGVLLGTATVAADGSFSVPLSPVQVTGATVSVTQADAAGNVSPPANAVAPFDIQAFANTDTASVDLVPVTTDVAVGNARYTLLLGLGAVNLQAQVLAVPNVQFTVAQGHTLDTTFTYNADIDLGVLGGYSVVVQRFDGTNWVPVNGTQASPLLELGLFNGNLTGTETLGPGQYRAFVAYQTGLGVGVLGNLEVTGRDFDFTDVGSVVPAAATGNVITDPGDGGAVDIVSAATRVDSVTVNGVVTAVTANGTLVDGAFGTLVINLDGSYTYTPDPLASVVGKTDVFTYTLIDPSDGERESANLSITIGSGDITGAPIAANDVANADVTYRNVEITTPPATAFSYTTGLGGGGDNRAFTVAANTTADVTITAARTGGVTLLPSYTLTVRDASNAVVGTVTSLSVLGGSATLTVDDLPAGRYTYSVSSPGNALGYTSSVSIGTTTTLLNSFEVATRETVQGNLFDNDTANTPFAALHVATPSGFVEVGDTPLVLTGAHGTLTVNEVGGYTYQPLANLPYSTVDLVDTFTYQLVQPNGVAATATLTVTVDVPPLGTANLQAAVAQVAFTESDVIALDHATAHADAATAAVAPPEAAAISLAAYDLFEGKGDLEDVLTHYLADHAPDQPPLAPATDHPVTVMTSAMPAIVDPLDYLVSPEDHDRNGITTNHVV